MTREMTYNDGVVTVPAGRYFLSDPCYAIRDEEWDGWLDSTGNTNAQTVFVGQTPSGAWAMAFSTKYGDGVYHDESGRSFGVDAGMIGLVPVDHNPDCGEEIIEFAVDTDCYVDEDGESYVLHFGPVAIETGDADDEDDYDEDSDDEDGDD